MIDLSKRRTLRRSVLPVAACLGLHPFAQAQGFGDKPITIVFPFGAGGAIDAIIRTMAVHLSDELKTPVIVDNKPGAASMIGAGYVARAPKDGRTLLWGAWLTFVTAFDLFKDLKFTAADFAPVTSTLKGYIGVAVPEKNPANNFSELLEQVKKTGGAIEYGCVGSGTSAHLMMELGQSKLPGTKLNLVLYKSEQQGIFDLLGGHLPMYVGSLSNMEPHQGKGLKVIAVSSSKRLNKFPSAPTFREVGLPELEFAYWHGVAAPAGTPAATVNSLSESIGRAMRFADVQEKLSVDQELMTMKPAEFASLIKADTDKWGAVIRKNGITAG